MAQDSASDLGCRLTQAQRELTEAREQLAATSEMLRVISSSAVTHCLGLSSDQSLEVPTAPRFRTIQVYPKD
jgi:hypothetical protein